MSKFATAIQAGRTVVELGNSARDLHGKASEFHTIDTRELGRNAGQHAFTEGAQTGKTMGKTWLKTFEVIPRMVCRGLQFLFAIIAIGFYGNRVDADRKAHDGYSPEWLFAVTVAGLSAISSVLFIAAAPISAMPFVGSKLKFVKTYRAFAWDLTLFIAWIVVFGIFAGIFLKRDSEHKYKGSSTGAMKTAVWVDLVNSLFWLTSGVYGCVKTFLGEKMDEMTDKAGNKLFSKKQASSKETDMKDYANSV